MSVLLARPRPALFLLAIFHALLCRYVHSYVLADTGLFTYMGIHWYPTNFWAELGFVLLAALPAAIFVPISLTRPSDAMILLLYGMVYIPITAILPNVTIVSLWIAAFFCMLSGAGLAILTGLSRWRVWNTAFSGGLPELQFDLLTYALAAITLVAYALFSPVTGLTLNLADLYVYRAAFFDAAERLPPLLRYVFVNSSLSLAPLMVARGMLQKKWLMVAVALVLAYMTFLITSYRSMIFGVLFVAAATFLVRLRPPLAISLFLFFLGIGGTTLALDAMSGVPSPASTFMIHHRIFGNSAVIADGYLSYFLDSPKFYYSQSFLSPFVDSPSSQAYQLSVGQSLSSVSGNHANGNIMSDAFANLGFPGIIVVFTILGGLMMVYNYLVNRKDLRAAAMALVVPAFSMTNTGLNSTILSGGLAMTFVLMALYPQGVSNPAPRRPRRR